LYLIIKIFHVKLSIPLMKTLNFPSELNEYDPKFWIGYNLIEPNKDIENFKKNTNINRTAL